MSGYSIFMRVAYHVMNPGTKYHAHTENALGTTVYVKGFRV